MMRSRDTTPSKSLRFKEPRKIQSDLATEEKKQADEDKDDSQVSNETNDSFFSLGSQMDVDSPRVMPRDVGKSPLVTKSFPEREQSPVKVRKPSGLLSNSSVSPGTKERLEKAMDAAEARLKQVTDESREVSVLEETNTTGLLGSKDVFLRLEDDGASDSDASMRGKVFHRWVGDKKDQKEPENIDIE